MNNKEGSYQKKMISREVSYMDIKDLTVFKKVAEEGSISKAKEITKLCSIKCDYEN